MIDRVGNKKARVVVAMAKVGRIKKMCDLNRTMVVIQFCNIITYLYTLLPQASAPKTALKVLDMAMQVHGAAGLSSDTVLAHLWATARTLRIADGPDEVHLGSIAKSELRKAKM